MQFCVPGYYLFVAIGVTICIVSCRSGAFRQQSSVHAFCLLAAVMRQDCTDGSDETGCPSTTTSKLVLGDVSQCQEVFAYHYTACSSSNSLMHTSYVYRSQSWAMKIAWACQATHAEVQSLAGGCTCMFNILSVKLVLVLVTSCLSYSNTLELSQEVKVFEHQTLYNCRLPTEYSIQWYPDRKYYIKHFRHTIH